MNSKVRVACRRCRIKRIKCDGSIPACSNCQKAREACIDVDGRNKSISIPRNFAVNAKARILWLEDHLKRCKPDLDLREGPHVDFAFLDPVETPMPRADVDNPERASTVGKRPSSLMSDQPPSEAFTREARFVALDLGLLTLNSDSRQMHYLGTSSGRLFTSLIGAPSSERASYPRGNDSPHPLAFSNPRASDTSAHTCYSKESLRSLYKTLRKTLPSREESDLLLETYFREIHSDHPFLHPNSLASAMEALHCCVDADETTEVGHNGWLCTVETFTYNGEADIEHTSISIFMATFHVYMVFALAAVIRTRRRLFDFAPDQFYRVALSVGHHCFSSTSLASIQAILLMAVHSLVGPAEVNIWTLTYLAMAHCIDLGLHRSPSPTDVVSKPAVLVRKMVFFSVYHLDRSIAVIQGRPLGIRDETFDLELPNLDEIIDDATTILNDSVLSGLPLAGDLAYTVHRFKLDPIFSEIKLLFYHLPSQISMYAWPVDHESSQHKIQHKLEIWRHELLSIEKVLDTTNNENRQVCRMYELKLMSQYFAAMILLYQPSQAIPQPSEQSLMLCYQCAANRLTSYNDLYYTESFCPTWRDVQGIFSSGATMIYCLWTSALVRESNTMVEVMRDLRICTNHLVLSIGGESWPSVKKGARSFTRAMDALLRELNPAAENRREAATEEEHRATQRRRLLNDHSPTIRRGLAEHAGSISHHTDSIFPAQWDDRTVNTSILPNEATWYQDTLAFHETITSYNQDTSYSGVVEDFISEFSRDDAAWDPF